MAIIEKTSNVENVIASWKNAWMCGEGREISSISKLILSVWVDEKNFYNLNIEYQTKKYECIKSISCCLCLLILTFE